MSKQGNSKDYKDLDFADDFLFCKILEKNLDLTKEILEVILNIKITKLKAVISQRSLKLTPFDHGVRLDIYVQDENETSYDIEMQATNEPSIGKRSRYYHGMIDLDSIENGSTYSELKKSYVIFVCKKKPSSFEINLPIYTFIRQCQEDKRVDLKDESITVVLNANGPKEGLSAELSSLLTYINTSLVTDELSSRLEKEVEDARSSTEWRIEYMTWQMKLDETYRMGRDDGIDLGKAQVISQLIQA